MSVCWRRAESNFILGFRYMEIDEVFGYFSDNDLAQIEHEVQELFEEHQNDVLKNSRARDYQMLYHHYLRKGQVERAWEFRIKSSETLANTSERSVFQRQGNVIAVLYNSNFAMERAKRFMSYRTILSYNVILASILYCLM